SHWQSSPQLPSSACDCPGNISSTASSAIATLLDRFPRPFGSHFPMPHRRTTTAIVALLASPLAQFCCAQFSSTAKAAEDSFPVAIHVDAGKTVGEMRPIWRFFGADEPNYAYMKD